MSDNHQPLGGMIAGCGRILCVALLAITCSSCKEEVDLKRELKNVNIGIDEAKTKLDQTAVEYRKALEGMRDATRDAARLGSPSFATENARKLEAEVQALEEKVSAAQATLDSMNKDMTDYKSKYLNK